MVNPLSKRSQRSSHTLTRLTTDYTLKGDSYFFRLNRCGVLGYCKGATFLRMKQEKNTKKPRCAATARLLGVLKKAMFDAAKMSLKKWYT